VPGASGAAGRELAPGPVRLPRCRRASAPGAERLLQRAGEGSRPERLLLPSPACGVRAAPCGAVRHLRSARRSTCEYRVPGGLRSQSSFQAYCGQKKRYHEARLNYLMVTVSIKCENLYPPFAGRVPTRLFIQTDKARDHPVVNRIIYKTRVVLSM